MCKFWISIALSLFSIILSGIAIAVTLPSIELSVNYEGVFLGVLSFAVTLLIGWNIYTVVDLKEYQKKYNVLNKKIERGVNYLHNKEDYNQGLSMAYNSMGLAGAISKESQENIKIQMLLQGAAALKTLSTLGEFGICQSVVNTLLETNSVTDKIILSEEEINNIHSLLMEVPHMDKIDGLLDLINMMKVE